MELDGRWKSFPTCPFCKNKRCAGVFERGGVEFFKCHHANCCTGGEVLTEVSYLALAQGLSQDKPAGGGPSPAYKALLELAGLWREPAPRQPAQAPPPTTAPEEEPPAVSEPPEGISEPTEVISEPLEVSSEPPEVISDQSSVASEPPAVAAEPGEPEGQTGPTDQTGATEAPATAGETAPDPEATEEAAPAERALRQFYATLTPATSEWKATLPGGNPLPDPLPGNLLKQVTYTPVLMVQKRGLTPEACLALGFRQNVPRNEQVLLRLQDDYDALTLVESGLWLGADRRRGTERRPNPQFAGLGIVAKKPAAERKHKDDKWHFGLCQPPLIPYFNARGQLVKLRPHKGGAPAGTAAGSERIYVPRVADRSRWEPEKLVEKFTTVVVCEGEFKAAAIWLTIGQGAMLLRGRHRPPVGVCALPGISFARNEAYREDLNEFLERVGAKLVIVAFDSEDNAGKIIEKRYPAVIYARYLARSLKAKSRVASRVLELPTAWRNARGKADWDGALAQLLWAK